MYDFVRFSLPPKYADKLRLNKELDFIFTIDDNSENKRRSRSGKEVAPFDYAHYKDMMIKIFNSDRIIFQGSLHKTWNDGEHNCNDFNFSNVREVLVELSEKFDFELKEAKILNLEFGLNIEIDHPIGFILDNLFFHKKVPFKTSNVHKEGEFLSANHNEYKIKVYDKSKQCDEKYTLPENSLRIENQYEGCYLRKRFRIYSLEDLFKKCPKRFFRHLNICVREILFFDYTINSESTRVLKYRNRNYWKNFIDNNQKSTYNKHFNILRSLIKDHSQDVVGHILTRLEDKFKGLANLRGVPVGGLPNSQLVHPNEKTSFIILERKAAIQFKRKEIN